MYDFDVRAYKDQLNKEWSEAKKDKTAKGQLLSNRLGRRWKLVYTAINNGEKSVSQLQSLVENLTHNWSLDDDNVKTFMEALSVEWHDHQDHENESETEEILSNRLGRRWKLVYTAINNGVKSVSQLQSLVENLTHNWSLDDDNVKTFMEALSVERHDHQDHQKESETEEILSNRLGRRWKLVYTAINNGVKSVSQLQHILLHKTCKWQLGDEMVNIFNEAKRVEWYDASDLEKYKDKAREFSSQWSDIYSEIGKKCKSVRTLQNRLGLPVNDNLQGDYDDYEVDAVTLEGMSPRKATLPQETTVTEPALKQCIKLQPAEWYCVLNGQSFGPVNLSQFANMKRFGIVDGNTLVWKEGMANWAIASTVADLQILI